MKTLLTTALAGILLLSCSKTDDTSTCIGGECDATMIFNSLPDKNGYYHVKLDWNREYYPYFILKAEASEVNQEYLYNGVGFVSADFNSDTTWVLGDSLVFQEPLYNPFENYTSSGTQLPLEVTNVVIDRFKGETLNIVQNTEIFFSKDSDGSFSTYRTVGPFPPELKNDTITLYMRIFWDAGSKSILKDHYIEKFIVE